MTEFKEIKNKMIKNWIIATRKCLNLFRVLRKMQNTIRYRKVTLKGIKNNMHINLLRNRITYQMSLVLLNIKVKKIYLFYNRSTNRSMNSKSKTIRNNLKHCFRIILTLTSNKSSKKRKISIIVICQTPYL